MHPRSSGGGFCLPDLRRPSFAPSFALAPGWRNGYPPAPIASSGPGWPIRPAGSDISNSRRFRESRHDQMPLAPTDPPSGRRGDAGRGGCCVALRAGNGLRRQQFRRHGEERRGRAILSARSDSKRPWSSSRRPFRKTPAMPTAITIWPPQTINWGGGKTGGMSWNRPKLSTMDAWTAIRTIATAIGGWPCCSPRKAAPAMPFACWRNWADRQPDTGRSQDRVGPA